MSQHRVQELSARIEALHARAAGLHKESRENADRLSDVAQGLIARLPRAEAAADAALQKLDPKTHAELLRGALQAEMDKFKEDFKRVSDKALALPARIQHLASGATLETVETSLTDLQEDVTEAFDGVSDLIEGRLSTEAFSARAEQALDTFEDLAETLETAAEQTRDRLEHIAQRMEVMAGSVGDTTKNATDVISDTWDGRADLLDDVFENHVINFGVRVERVEAKFGSVEARVVAGFDTLSELRVNLTELTEENAGPGENLADALGVISETLSSVSG
ncbi:MAG: hypothetical protein R3F50_18320 [Gammaproteobacteria bacterium]